MNSTCKELSQSSSELPKMGVENWECREHMNKNEAEQLLDWLEANGYSQREVALTADGFFTVARRR